AERAAMVQRFLRANAEDVTPAELLELVITDEPASSDARALAQRLLEEFGSFSKVVHAEEVELWAVEGMDSSLIRKLHILRLALHQTLKSQISTQPVILNWTALMDYCKLTLGHCKIEEFHVLFLNQRHALLADEVMGRGTVNHAPIYPREIAKRALELG